MNLKSKLFGVVTAATLLLGTGAAALAENSGTMSTLLEEGECTVEVSGGADSMNLGTWVYDGEKFVNEGGATASLIVSVTNHRYERECLVQTSSTNLYLGNATSGGIRPNHNLSISNPENGSQWLTWGFQDWGSFWNQTPAYDIETDVTLENVPKANVPGSYSGTLYFQVTNADPN